MPNMTGMPSEMFNDIPDTADSMFDDLFANPELDNSEPAPATTPASTPTSAQTTPAATNVPPTPQAPAADEFFLDAGTSKYKSREEAAQGLVHKDQLIENLRQQFIAQTGMDPITHKPVTQMPQGGPQAQPKTYLEDPSSYLNDLIKAAESNDAAGYAQVQARYVQELMSPVAPLIQELAKTKAENQITSQLKDFNDVRASAEFKAVLDELPDLKQAIEIAEGDYRLYDRLPGLYKTAYFAAQGRRLPSLLQQQTAAVTPPAPPRPITPATTPTPPTTPAVRPDVRTAEGRKALIQQFEARGILDKSF